FKTAREVYSFNWENLPGSFVLKPSKGYGGEGIIVLKKKAEKGWVSSQRSLVTVDDLKLHAIDILEGAYSVGNVPDVAFAEEFIGRHKLLLKYAYRGTPDIRVIVFNKVPVLAMLRLPTRESGGRANLHQGAIIVAIDIATGITTKAMHGGEFIKYKPVYSQDANDSTKKRKLHGIKIPHWNQILSTAVSAQIATGIGYLGADIILHPEKGPMVLELNSQPGLQIQVVNGVGLRRRLDKVEDLEIRDGEHGVRVAKALFASNFTDRVKAEEGIRTIRTVEEVKIRTQKGEKVVVNARVDTGAVNTSIDADFAKEIGVYDKEKILWHKRMVSALGIERRPIISLTYWLAGRKIKTIASVARRNHLPYKVLIGRVDLKGFLINPEGE
ncbi:MAG: sugar-transfer associated ATP-grasp domain-containing protein, partial [bacterium]|nr:sugar-transfer associated ATP-grasp domain-containing protein [bacterium]